MPCLDEAAIQAGLGALQGHIHVASPAALDLPVLVDDVDFGLLLPQQLTPTLEDVDRLLAQ